MSMSTKSSSTGPSAPSRRLADPLHSERTELDHTFSDNCRGHIWHSRDLADPRWRGHFSRRKGRGKFPASGTSLFAAYLQRNSFVANERERASQSFVR